MGPYNREVLPISDYSPRRVVSLQPSATLTLRDLGLLDRLVACTKYCIDVCPEADDGSKLIVSDSWSAQADQIMAARPELVITSVPYQLEAVAQILKAGVRILGLAPRTLADIFADIAATAGVMGVFRRGDDVIASMQEDIKAIRRQVSHEGRKPRVFCEEWGKPLIASQPWVAELVEAAGGEFLCTPGKSTDAETVATLQPDFLFAAWCGAGDRVPLEKLVEQRGWSQVPAALAGRIFCIKDELLNTPGTCLISGLRAIAWALHPELLPKPTGIRPIRSL
jgi:iron complex transport system substrate-binding protein